jgi:hypothetical protein
LPTLAELETAADLQEPDRQTMAVTQRPPVMAIMLDAIILWWEIAVALGAIGDRGRPGRATVAALKCRARRKPAGRETPRP